MRRWCNRPSQSFTTACGHRSTKDSGSKAYSQTASPPSTTKKSFHRKSLRDFGFKDTGYPSTTWLWNRGAKLNRTGPTFKASIFSTSSFPRYSSMSTMPKLGSKSSNSLRQLMWRSSQKNSRERSSYCTAYMFIWKKETFSSKSRAEIARLLSFLTSSTIKCFGICSWKKGPTKDCSWGKSNPFAKTSRKTGVNSSIRAYWSTFLTTFPKCPIWSTFSTGSTTSESNSIAETRKCTKFLLKPSKGSWR